MGALDEAEGHLRAAVAQMPWAAAAHYKLGRCLLLMGRDLEAAPHLAATDSLQQLARDIILAKFAVRRNPTQSADWFMLALLYHQTSQAKESREALGIARQLNN